MQEHASRSRGYRMAAELANDATGSSASSCPPRRRRRRANRPAADWRVSSAARTRNPTRLRRWENGSSIPVAIGMAPEAPTGRPRCPAASRPRGHRALQRGAEVPRLAQGSGGPRLQNFPTLRNFGPAWLRVPPRAQVERKRSRGRASVGSRSSRLRSRRARMER